jgi:hypothetical protein
MESSRWADVHARWILTVQAGNGDIDSLPQEYDSDPAALWITYVVVVKGADQLAHAAAAANLLRILSVFEVANPLSGHLILPTRSTRDSPYPYLGVELPVH